MMVPTVEGKVLEQLDESFEEEEEVAQALAIRAVFVVFSITGRRSWVASRAANATPHRARVASPLRVSIKNAEE